VIAVNCSLLYAATIRALPEVRSSFSRRAVPPTDEKYRTASDLRGTEHLLLASHSGCACGWGYRGNDTEWDLLDLGSVDRLAAYLREQISDGDISLISSRFDLSDRSLDEPTRLSLEVFLSQFQMWRVRSSASYAAVAELTGGSRA
jgi:hypothetical protein